MKKIYIYLLIFTFFNICKLTANENLPFLENIQDFLNSTTTQSQNSSITHKKDKETIISKIIISGNITHNKVALKNSLLIRDNEIFNPYKLNNSIKNLYELGSFSKITPFIEKDKETNAYVLTIVCKQYPLLKKINYVGNRFVSDEQLNKLSSIKLNKVRNMKDIRDTVKKINEEYSKLGYIHSGVTNIEFPENADHQINLIIEEALIKSITITGNTKTQDYVILREIEIKENTIVNEKTLQLTARKIYNLNHFENVIPEVTLSEDKNNYNVNFKIVEKDSQGSLSLGGGYGGHSGFSLFSNISWDNLKGTGQQLFLNTNLAFGNKNNTGQNTYQIKYHNPWAWDKRKSFTFRTWLTNGDLNLGPFGDSGSISYRKEKRSGYDIKIGWPITYNFYTLYTLKYEMVNIQESQKQYEILSGTYTLNYDKRDVRINPRKGYLLTAKFEQSLKLSPSMLNYNRIEMVGKYYIPTFKKQVIAFKLETGILNSPNISDSNIYSSEYYYIGGPNTVRGYDQMTPFANGNKKILFTTEYRFIFTQKFQLIFFVDIGSASLDNIFNRDDYKHGKGFGIRFNIPPLGPIRLDLGFNEENESELHFSIGQTF